MFYFDIGDILLGILVLGICLVLGLCSLVIKVDEWKSKFKANKM